MIKIAMFDSKQYDKDSFEPYLNDNIKMVYYETKLNLTTVSLTKGYDCVIVFVNDEVDKDVIDKLIEYKIKLLALRSSGFNNVDIISAQDRLPVVRVPAYSPNAIAEHTMALLLTSIRRIHKAYNRTREYNFSIEGLTGFNLHEKTIGIIGTGKIGKALIDICSGFGMNIMTYDKFPVPIQNTQNVSLMELFSRSDIISLHCPLNEETYHLISEREIRLMKDGVIIVNTSRGELINTEDLLDAIKKKKIGAACLDVYEEESELFFNDKSGHILKDDILARLLSMPNVIITSHQAFLTKEALDKIAETTMDNIISFFNEGILKNEVKIENKVVK